MVFDWFEVRWFFWCFVVCCCRVIGGRFVLWCVGSCLVVVVVCFVCGYG